MKKSIPLITILLIFTMTLSAFAFQAGDVNNDGKITSVDYISIKKYFSGSLTLVGDALNSADVNCDGKITSADYLLLRNIFKGTASLPSSKPSSTPTPSTPTSAPNVCSHCNGKGYLKVYCVYCDGKGTVGGAYEKEVRTTCSSCNGTGKIVTPFITGKCGNCHGKGYTTYTVIGCDPCVFCGGKGYGKEDCPFC